MTPGSNILKTALRAIRAQNVLWYRFISRDTNAIGLQVTKFSPAFNARGSFQPIPRNLFEHMGLEFNKSYVAFFATSDVEDLQRDTSGDQFVFNGERYQVMNNTEWFPIDGWNQSIAVKLTP